MTSNFPALPAFVSLDEAVQELDLDVTFVSAQGFEPKLDILPAGAKFFDVADKENLGQPTFSLSSAKTSSGIILIDIDGTLAPEQK